MALQTFSNDAKPQKIGEGYVGQFSKNTIMKEGTWIAFGSTNFITMVTPGKKVDLVVKSSAPPGLVECRVAGGRQGMKGVGEEMPEELENILPGYEAWPSGYTIGPDDKLKGISKQEKISYLLKTLPQCQKQGWITSGTSQIYERLLKKQDLQGIFKRLGNDLKTNSITTEVFAIIEGMKNP